MVRTRLRTLIGEERAAVALEMALLAPVLISLIFGVIQMGLMMYVHHSMLNTVQETTRSISLGLLNAAAAEARAQADLPGWVDSYTMTIDDDGIDVTVTLVAPMGEAGIIDPLGLFEGREVSASATMRRN